MYQAFLIKYAEIGIKGKNRYLFEDMLLLRIRESLRRIDGDFTVEKESGRAYVIARGEFDYDGALEALKKVFGISGICPVVILDTNEFEEIAQGAVKFFGEVYPDRNFTFKVFTRRGRKDYPMDSMEISAEIGGRLIEAYPELKVDVHDPQVSLHVEVRNRVYLYSEEIPGPGGMPVGCAGKAMLLLSGGIDSPVAGYMVSKRGVSLEAVYFHAPPYTSERAKQKVVDLAKIVAQYSGPIDLHVINFTDIQMAIYEKCPHDELTIIMRRYMMKIAESIARKTDALALVTGESIGQVASQTMQSLACTNAVCTLPVFRPLIAFDKQDIVTVSKKIDTYETSILPFEDCCTIFVAKHPVTKPLLKQIEKSEKNLADIIDELVQTALAEDEVIHVEA